MKVASRAGAAPVERALEEARDQRLQLRLRTGRRQVTVPHVIVEVEVAVVDPHRLVHQRRETGDVGDSAGSGAGATRCGS